MRAVSMLLEATKAGKGLRSPRAVYIAAPLVAALFLFPLGYLMWGTLTLGEGFWETVASRATLAPLRNSLAIAMATTAACGVLGTSLAWLVARTDLPGHRVWRAVLPLPLVIPSFVGATALIAAFGRGGLVTFVPRIEGFWGAFGVLTLLTYPYVYLPVVARLTTTAPALEEASQLLGGTTPRTIRRIVIPQVRDTALGGMLLVFLYVLSDFGAVTLMRYDTITRAIFSSRLFDRSTSLTLGLVLALLALGVAGGARLLAGRGTARGASRAPQIRYRLGRGTAPALAAVGSVVGLALAAPIAVFVTWVVRGSATVGLGYSGLGDGLGFLVEPMLNSALAAGVAAVIAVVVVLPVAYLGARRRGWLPAVASASVASVFALPGLVVALAVVFWAIRAPAFLAGVYQSFPLLILAYVLHFGAQSMQASQAAIADVAPTYDEAAQTLGAGPGRRFVSIDLPLIRPGLIAGGGLVLLSTLKELPATLLLAPIGFQTLATRIWGAAEDGFYAEVGITSLVLIALSGVLTWAFVLRRQPA